MHWNALAILANKELWNHPNTVSVNVGRKIPPPEGGGKREERYEKNRCLLLFFGDPFDEWMSDDVGTV